MKRKTVKRRLKIKVVPPEVQAFIAAPPPEVPEAVVVLVAAVAHPEAEVYVPEAAIQADPTLWERLKKWWMLES